MANSLLIPLILGPISILSPTVKVIGALSGATVDLFRNGQVLGSDVADDTGCANIDVAGLNLAVGDQLYTRQIKGPEQSPFSTVPEIVIGTPQKLSPLIFLSKVHSCADVVLLGGCAIGASIEIRHNGAVIGGAQAFAPETLVPILVGGILPVGQTITAQQTLQGKTSTPTPSLPIAPFPALDRTPPTPTILEPVYDCDTMVVVTDIVDGLATELVIDGNSNSYPTAGGAVGLGTHRLTAGQTITARQWSRICKVESAVSNKVGVRKLNAKALPTPKIHEPICPDQRTIEISGLRPGATISIFAGLNSGQQTLVGRATAASSTQVFQLPPNIDVEPGKSPDYLVAEQSQCGFTNPTSLKAPITMISASNTPGFGPIFECARGILVSAPISTTIRLTSDDPTTPVLSRPVLITDTGTGLSSTEVFVVLYRPLIAGETVTVSATGCMADAGKTSSRRVQPIAELSRHRIMSPVRAHHTSVWVVDVIPGSQVHVFINNKWRNRVEAYESAVEVPVGLLQEDDVVTALYTICAAVAPITDPGVVVTLGDLNVEHQPKPIVRGASPSMLTIVAKDQYSGRPVYGTFVMPNGTSQTTNEKFSYTFPLGQGAGPITVRAPGYKPKTIGWELVDPAPVAPPEGHLRLNLKNLTGKVVTKVEWYVAVDGANGYVVDREYKGDSVTHKFVKANPGVQQRFYVDCNVTLGSGADEVKLSQLFLYGDPVDYVAVDIDMARTVNLAVEALIVFNETTKQYDKPTYYVRVASFG